jgi:type IV pilus assembly protein PilB
MFSLQEEIKEWLVAGSDAKTARIIDKILSFAIGCEAEEIIFEPTEGGLAVNLSADRSLKSSFLIPKGLAEPFIGVLKKISGLNNDQLSRGIGKKDCFGSKVIFSFATHNTKEGEKIVVELKKEKFQLLDPGRLGLPPASLASVKKRLDKRKGLILVAGNNDSGRTTTLYSLLNYLNRPEFNLATLEGEISFNIPGVNQSRVDQRRGFDHRSALHHLRRQDADVIMVGEIGDRETALGVVDLAHAGHLVLAGISAANIDSVFDRLKDWGIDMPFFASAASLIIVQRLADRNCPFCLSERKPTIETWRRLKGKIDFKTLPSRLKKDRIIPAKINQAEKLKFYKSKGCPRCGGTGHAGKIGIFEVLEIDKEAGDIIRSGHFCLLRERIVKQGNYLLAEDYFAKAAAGLVVIEKLSAAI